MNYLSEINSEVTSEVNMNEENNNEINNEINRLELLQKEYYNEIKNIGDKIKHLQCKKYKNCIHKNGKHKIESIREDGPYGETYYYCKYCNCDL